MNSGFKIFLILTVLVLPGIAADNIASLFVQTGVLTLYSEYRAYMEKFDEKGRPGGAFFDTDVCQFVNTRMILKYKIAHYSVGLDVGAGYYRKNLLDLVTENFGMGDTRLFTSRTTGDVRTGIKISIPTGEYKRRLGSGAFAIMPYGEYEFKETGIAGAAITFSLSNPDGDRKGIKSEAWFDYQWYVEPGIRVELSTPDKLTWTDIKDTPSALVRLNLGKEHIVFQKLKLFWGMYTDVMGRDVEKFTGVRGAVGW